MTTKQKGGEVVASGGFGCIFNPSLKCKNVDVGNNEISKLMTKKHAKDEFTQIQKYNKLLGSIPNYNMYFLLDDFKLCKPTKLTKNDLKGYQKKCKALKKRGINIKNINQSLEKLLAINMPNGGIDVEIYIETYFTSFNLIKLNNSLIQLLMNGIVPMNKLNVYHCDIKDGNVLVKITKNGLETRLIDWGLSFIFNNEQHGIPRKIYRRPFQFNVPFSSILFNKDFVDLYNNFLKLNSNPNYFQIREFVVNYIFIWNDIRGPGHLSTINDIIKKLTIKELISVKNNKIKEHFIEYDFTYYYVVEYLSKILEKYTNNGGFEMMSYFRNVFLKNIDIWGFIMIYFVFYEKLYDGFNKLNQYQIEFMNKIKYIIIHFLYESPTNPIDITLIIKELTNLNNVIEKLNLLTNVKNISNIGGFLQDKKRQKSYKKTSLFRKTPNGTIIRKNKGLKTRKFLGHSKKIIL